MANTSNTNTSSSSEAPSTTTTTTTSIAAPTDAASNIPPPWSNSNSTPITCHGYLPCVVLFCLLPSILGIALFFGIFVLPAVVLACCGLSLFCLAATTTTSLENVNHGNHDDNVSSLSTKRYSRQEIQKHSYLSNKEIMILPSKGVVKYA